MSSSSSMPTTMTSTTLPWKYRLIEPHIAFVLFCVAFKILLPSILKWLSYDTITTSIISIWYPLCCTIYLIHRESQPTTPTRTKSSMEEDKKTLAAQERKFWIDYWTVGYSLAQLINQTIRMTIPFFHYSTSLPQILSELQFLFFVWVFAMEPLLSWYQCYLTTSLDHTKKDVGSSPIKRFLPLSILKRLVRRRLLEVHTRISDPISKENWQRYIHSKAHKILNLLVALQFLSEEWNDYLLHLLDECRSLLLLSPFLILPASITRIGILYAQYVLPSARSMMAHGKIIEVLYLQYWVLNILLSTAVYLGSWVWWFVPFSTQIIFAIWCYLTFPRTMTEYYAVVEQELITFGILSGEAQLAVNETKTVQALRAVVKRLPSANDAEGFQWAADTSVESRYGSRSKREVVPRSQSAPATLLAISAIKALHDSAVLSPQHEEDEDEEEYDEAPRKGPVRPRAVSKLSKSLPTDRDFNKSDRLMDPPLHQEQSSVDVPLIEEWDESSQGSTKAMVNIDLRSNDKKVYEEVEVTMKELSAARLRAAKTKSKSPINKNINSHRKSNPAPYHSPIKSSIMHAFSDEQSLRPSLSSLALPPTLSTRSVSDTCTPRSNASCGFELSDIDTAASPTGLEAIESFDSAGAFHDGSKRAQRRGASPSSSKSGKKGSTPDDIARRAQRRSERIRKLQEKREQRKLSHLTESLLFLRSASTDESEGGARSVDSSFISETSSSTGNQAVASQDNNSTDGGPRSKMRRRRQRSSDSDRSLSESHNQIQRKSSYPRYVNVESTDGLRDRRARRSRSRDNATLISVDSDKVAQ